MTTQLEALLADLAEARLLEVTATGTTISASTRAAFATPADATVAAHELLAMAVRLGFHFHGGLVGAERCAGGAWRGELVEVVLADAA